jgi:hypothetical protein
MIAKVLNKNEDKPSYKAAMAGPEIYLWRQGVDEELNRILELGVWDRVPQPADVKIFISKWALARKRNEHNEVVRHKARLVLRGYEQVAGRDYDETYAAVVRNETARLLLSLAAKYDWEVDQLDAVIAFLNSPLDREIYMWPPKEYKVPKGMVCKVKLALYGMKQSAKLWADTCGEGMRLKGYTQSKYDTCLWYRTKDKVYVTTHVDDFKIYAPTREAMDAAKQELKELYLMRDLGPISHYLGQSIVRDRKARTIHLTQTAAINRILEEVGMTQCTPCATPMEYGTQLEGAQESSHIVDQETYAKRVGQLLHLATNTRPDIAFTVGRLAQFTSNPDSACWAVLKHLLRYLKGTRTKGIIYGLRSNSITANEDEEDSPVEGYTDADWAGDTFTIRSTTGYVFMSAGGPIAWGSRKQSVVALSTCEAEYIAASYTSCMATWLRNLLDEVGLTSSPTPPSIPLAIDNQGAIALAKMGAPNRRTRHINIRYHHFRECAEEGIVDPHYVPTDEMLADGFTKALNRLKFNTFAASIGMHG